MRTKIWDEKLNSEMNVRYYGTMITVCDSLSFMLKIFGVAFAATGPTSLLIKSVDASTSKHLTIVFGYLAAICTATSIPLAKYCGNLKRIRDKYCSLNAEWDKLWLKAKSNGAVKIQEVNLLLTKKGEILKDEGNVLEINRLVIFHQKKVMQANGV